MERDPQPPKTTPEATPTPNTKRASFFEKWNKRVKKQGAEATKPAPETLKDPQTPEVATLPPERKSFGKNIMKLLFGNRSPEQQVVPVTPEAQAPQPLTPEQTPQYDRATRMRRLARVILANVLGQVEQEPARAQKLGEAQPLNTEPLAEAAQNLQSAVNTLGDTIDHAQTGPNYATAALNFGGNYDPRAQPERSAPPIEQDVNERIDRRLRRLEAAAEDHRAASVAAVGLGVLAVILTGTEYFGRRRADKKIRRETTEQFAQQEKAINQQRAEFDQLRQEQTTGMDRNQRHDYYERLSTFTNSQAEQTRQVDHELQEVVIAHTPESTQIQQGEVYERREWRPRQPERAAAPQSREQASDREPQPMLRVENNERTERQPGQQTGSAGTGFFGGGGGGIASGTGLSDLTTARGISDPNSPEARKLEALRKAEQRRLQQNAWFYGATLIATLGVLLIVTIVLG